MLKIVAVHNEEETQTEIIRDIITLINYFFVYMNHDSWEAYWDDDELDWNNEKKALLFWSQYCLVEANDYNDKKKKYEIIQLNENNKHHEKEINCRNKAIESLGEDIVIEYEYILPKLNWRIVLNDTEYANTMVDALNQYYYLKDLLSYCKNEPVEEYCLYSSRLFAEKKENEVLPFYEYKELYFNNKHII